MPLEARGSSRWSEHGRIGAEVEIYQDHGLRYGRTEGEDRFAPLPIMGMSYDRLPIISAFWALVAVEGVVAAEMCRQEALGTTLTDRIALGLSLSKATQATGLRLDTPGARTDRFAGHVWIDAESCLRRISVSWPMRPLALSRVLPQDWITTTLTDFGVDLPLTPVQYAADGG
jgi:hypothetical protein